MTRDGRSPAVFTKPSKQSSVHDTMRVPGTMRCFGAAPPNVYTRSRCSGVQRNVGAVAGISPRSGAGRVAPTPVALGVAVADVSGAEDSAALPRARQAVTRLATPRGI